MNMTIDETIQAAATKFNLSVAAIRNVGLRKDRLVTRARQWIVQQHEEMGASELARAIGYANHTGIINMRKRIKQVTHIT